MPPLALRASRLVSDTGTLPLSTDHLLSRLFIGVFFTFTAINFNVTNFAFDPDRGATALQEAPPGGPNPVPEPSALSLFLVGFSLLLAIAPAYCSRIFSLSQELTTVIDNS